MHMMAINRFKSLFRSDPAWFDQSFQTPDHSISDELFQTNTEIGYLFDEPDRREEVSEQSIVRDKMNPNQTSGTISQLWLIQDRGDFLSLL
jgi:hypothetical protein